MSKYAVCASTPEYADWFFFNAPNKKAAEKKAREIVGKAWEIPSGEDTDVIIIVDGITRGKTNAISEARAGAITYMQRNAMFGYNRLYVGKHAEASALELALRPIDNSIYSGGWGVEGIMHNYEYYC